MSKLQEWQQQLEQMKRCANAAELVGTHGQPPHKQQHDSMEIWHYPLGIEDGTLYSIHAAVMPDQSMQVYMHMEPATDVRPLVRVRKSTPAWIKHLQTISFICIGFGLFFYFRGPATNNAQLAFRLAVIGFGLIGAIVSYVLEWRSGG